ncbi:MAG: hypothetical protein J4G18_18725 [Anaerolineae bacterium]|nr:hypothetical protein [Anaerolineae bacterium]
MTTPAQQEQPDQLRGQHQQDQQQQQHQLQQQQQPSGPYASLIQDLRSYQAEPHGHDHVDRWTRALAGLGHASHTNPMSLSEAEQMAKIHNPNRWNPVVEAMKKLGR